MVSGPQTPNVFALEETQTGKTYFCHQEIPDKKNKKIWALWVNKKKYSETSNTFVLGNTSKLPVTNYKLCYYNTEHV